MPGAQPGTRTIEPKPPTGSVPSFFNSALRALASPLAMLLVNTVIAIHASGLRREARQRMAKINVRSAALRASTTF